MKLTIDVTKNLDGYTGQLKEFPQVISDGKTEAELLDNIKDAFVLYLDYLRDRVLMDKTLISGYCDMVRNSVYEIRWDM